MLGHGVMAAPWFLAPVVGVQIPVPQPLLIQDCTTCYNLNMLKKNVIGGYILSCIGDDKNHSCMFTKQLTCPSDEAIIESYKKLKMTFAKTYSEAVNEPITFGERSRFIARKLYLDLASLTNVSEEENYLRCIYLSLCF